MSAPSGAPEAPRVFADSGHARRLRPIASVLRGLHQVGQHVGRPQHNLDTASSALSVPERTRSSVVSKMWAKRTRASSSNAPAPPLTECTARKTALTVSSIGFARLQREQTRLQLGQQLLALLEEGVLDCLQRVHGRSPIILMLRAAQRAAELDGVERLDDPAGRAGVAGAAFFSLPLSVVSTRIGMAR